MEVIYTTAIIIVAAFLLAVVIYAVLSFTSFWKATSQRDREMVSSEARLDTALTDDVVDPGEPDVNPLKMVEMTVRTRVRIKADSALSIHKLLANPILIVAAPGETRVMADYDRMNYRTKTHEVHQAMVDAANLANVKPLDGPAGLQEAGPVVNEAEPFPQPKKGTRTN